MEQHSVPFERMRVLNEPLLPSLTHFNRLMGDHGIIQFTKGRTPDLDSGFCLDDNARALLVAVAYLREGQPDPVAQRMGDICIEFFADASREAPCYHNVMDRDGTFVDECASPESVGRLIWALGVTATCAVDARWRDASWQQLAKISHAVGALTSTRAMAYAMLGLAAIVDPDAASPVRPVRERAGDADVRQWARETLYAMAASMRFEFLRTAQPDWMWWEPELTYDNARLPEAMLRAASALHEPSFAETGLASMQFLMEVTQPADMFVPIGAPGWYRKGGERPVYDQQPLEAAAMVDMFLAAQRWENDSSYRQDARVAFDWFIGNNVAGLALADEDVGSCFDGLRQNGLNLNMGAESTLAYLQAALFLGKEPQPKALRARRSTRRKSASTTIASIDAARLPATIIED
ncbi:MAG TPA: hypothetical protein VFE36_06735 [Candidatus Baltobacteraceae bacterium]|jgi:hypothetical protein|nr:hypothetical protein [Candidatus Baltobacteraceae bacterium]